MENTRRTRTTRINRRKERKGANVMLNFKPKPESKQPTIFHMPIIIRMPITDNQSLEKTMKCRPRDATRSYGGQTSPQDNLQKLREEDATRANDTQPIDRLKNVHHLTQTGTTTPITPLP